MEHFESYNFDNVTQKICLEYGAAPREVKSNVNGAQCNMGTLQCRPATRCLPANLLQSPIIDYLKNNHSSLLAMIAKSVGKSSTSICIFNDKLLVIRGISSCPRTAASLNSVWGKWKGLLIHTDSVLPWSRTELSKWNSYWRNELSWQPEVGCYK